MSLSDKILSVLNFVPNPTVEDCLLRRSASAILAHFLTRRGWAVASETEYGVTLNKGEDVCTIQAIIDHGTDRVEVVLVKAGIENAYTVGDVLHMACRAAA